MKGIIHYQTEEYGCIKVKLSGVLKSLGITRNQLRTLTGVKYEVIDRYYKGEEALIDTPNGCPFAFLIRPNRLLPKSQF